MALIRDGIAPPEPGDATASPWAMRPLAEEVRDVQASRRRSAAAEAGEQADVTVEELLERAHREAELVAEADGGGEVEVTRAANVSPRGDAGTTERAR